MAKTDYKQFRRKLNINQGDFWSRLGVTQSGGSRYENGRVVPKPVALLFDLAYSKKPLESLANLRGVDLSVLLEGRL